MSKLKITLKATISPFLHGCITYTFFFLHQQLVKFSLQLCHKGQHNIYYTLYFTSFLVLSQDTCEDTTIETWGFGFDTPSMTFQEMRLQSPFNLMYICGSVIFIKKKEKRLMCTTSFVYRILPILLLVGQWCLYPQF